MDILNELKLLKEELEAMNATTSGMMDTQPNPLISTVTLSKKKKDKKVKKNADK